MEQKVILVFIYDVKFAHVKMTIVPSLSNYDDQSLTYRDDISSAQ